MNTVRFEIPEAGIVFEAPDGWSFVGKMGTLDQGRVEYNYTHDHVRGNGRAVNPAIIVTVDKGSWFDDEKNYLEEKIQFYEAMDDRIEKTHPPGDKHNPLKIKAYYSEGISGDPENPFGERFILITFWTEKAGFHMEIHTSGNDLKAAYEAYNAMLKSIRKI
ncbi:MAG: hypothetical protein KDD04_06980 [Sinomicrobium sp.]|nr:hypothetical protein [Sinomicrobium sp.]